MDESNYIEQELEKKKRLPIEVRRKINLVIFKNLIIALVVMLYLFLINYTYNRVGRAFEEYVKIYACVAGIVSVLLFEVAYNKNSRFFCLMGIELLFCGVVSIFIPYIYLHTTSYLRTIVIILPGILFVYYLLKALIIRKKGQIEYINSLSDIKDILKDDKESYLDERSGKTFKNKLKEEEKLKEIIKKEQEIRKKKKSEQKKEEVQKID